MDKGDIFEYRGNKVEILGYNKRLTSYKVLYLGKERYVAEKTLEKDCVKKEK